MPPSPEKQSPPSTTSETPNPRKRGRTACTRCKNRKQKCDDQHPICSNCRKSGAACDKADVADEALPVAYTRALEDRVAFLETSLEQLQQPERAEIREVISRSHASNQREQIDAVSNSQRQRDNALGDIVALISLGNPEEPAYVGSSSGMSIAKVLSDLVQATVWNKSIPEVTSPISVSEEGGVTVATGEDRESGRKLAIAEIIANSVKEPPTDELGSRMIQAYLSQLHPRYPFLDQEEIWNLHKQRASFASASPKSISRDQRFGIFKLYLLYASGATLLRLTENRAGIAPESFYLSALQHISAARESRTIQNIEAMTLLVVYHLRSASSHGMWYMIGLAMRTCIDLGMHRRGFESNLSPEVIHRRRRLFWTVYSLERTISISLGRPTSISDRQIDVPLPEVDATLPLASTPGENLTIALHLFRLRKLESQIHHSIYRVDKPLHALLPKLDTFYSALAGWKSSLSSSFPPSSPEIHYPLLHYHRAIRLLIQPFLPLLSPSDAYLRLCLSAAGDICQAHKRLHQSLDYGHSFIAVQTVFVAGMTMLYGLSQWVNEVWDAKLANDIRACSLVLFVMGERAQWVRRYRDAFEVLVDAAMEKLNGGSSRATDSSSKDRMSSSIAPKPQRETGNFNTQEHHRENQMVEGSREVHGGLPPADKFWSNEGIGIGDGNNAWPIVMELTNWIEQDASSPIWMPDFETLQNL